MKTLEEIKEVIIQHKEDLKRNFKVKGIGILDPLLGGRR
jgi:hypothetical protein